MIDCHASATAALLLDSEGSRPPATYAGCLSTPRFPGVQGSAAVASASSLAAVDCSSPSTARLSHVANALSHLLPHRSRSLLAALQTRAARPQYHLLRRKQHIADLGICAVIVGAGPIGLRCAIELALLGVSVQVLEARDAFTRLQVSRTLAYA